MRRGPVIVAGLVLVALAVLGVWRYTTRPEAGPRVPVPGRPACPEVVSLVRPPASPRLVCLAELPRAAGRLARTLHCRLVHLPRVVAGDRVAVEAGPGPDCKVTVGRLAGASLLALGLPIDLNRASAEDLAALPGIGPAKAEAIVADRTAHGPFESVDDLTRVKGIGPKTVARLRGQLTVAP